MTNPTITHKIIQSGCGQKFWAQARGGTVRTENQSDLEVIVTAQPNLRSGSDVYYGLSEWRSRDLGETWEGPFDHSDALGRRTEADGTVVAICDMTPAWHAATGKLLSTGHTVRYANDRHPLVGRRREMAYSVYDSDSRTWSQWRTLRMPDRPEFANAGAGCTQRVDLEDGTILLPVYHKSVSSDEKACCQATVLRCRFDRDSLEYLEHGDTLHLDVPRGFCEPSLIRCGGRFFLTLRNDENGYVTAGNDGLHFETPILWCFDDGSNLGNYNTQQHWVTHRDSLFLAYTRRGLNNDNAMRHRAPLMMAEVDQERLVVLRDTEQELVPNRGAGLGNFGVCVISDDESWVIVSEFMKPFGCEQYGSDNSIWVAKIRWDAQPQSIITTKP